MCSTPRPAPSWPGPVAAPCHSAQGSPRYCARTSGACPPAARGALRLRRQPVADRRLSPTSDRVRRRGGDGRTDDRRSVATGHPLRGGERHSQRTWPGSAWRVRMRAPAMRLGRASADLLAAAAPRGCAATVSCPGDSDAWISAFRCRREAPSWKRDASAIRLKPTRTLPPGPRSPRPDRERSRRLPTYGLCLGGAATGSCAPGASFSG
jgi:hypothetical protein